MGAPRLSVLRFARVAFGVHLATVFFGVALSNIFLAFAVLATPFARVGAVLRARRARPLLWTLGVWLAVLVVAVLLSIDPGASARALSEPFNLATVVLAVALGQDERSVRRFLDVVIAVAVALGLLGTLQLVVQGEAGLASRVKGGLSHYMTFSGILVIGGSFLLARAIFVRRYRWLWIATVPIAIALVASLTRSAWVGLVAALLLLLVLRSPRLPLLVFPPLVLLFVLVAPQAARDRLVSVFDPSDRTNYDRLCMADAGLRMAADRPLIGIGPELVERVYPIYRHPTAPRLEVPHLHNAPLQILAEMGIFGLGAWLLLLGVAARAAWRRYQDEGGRAGPRPDFWLGALAALVAFLVAGLFEDNWGDSEVRRLALVALAVPFCAAIPSTRNDPSEPTGPRDTEGSPAGA